LKSEVEPNRLGVTFDTALSGNTLKLLRKRAS